TAFEIRAERKAGLYLDADLVLFRQKSVDGSYETKNVVVHFPEDVDPARLNINVPTWDVKVSNISALSRTSARICFQVRARNGSGRKRGRLVISAPATGLSYDADFIILEEAIERAPTVSG